MGPVWVDILFFFLLRFFSSSWMRAGWVVPLVLFRGFIYRDSPQIMRCYPAFEAFFVFLWWGLYEVRSRGLFIWNHSDWGRVRCSERL